MGRIDKFVQACIAYCNDDSHGYSQTNDRFGHPDFDCSGLIYQCAYDAGYDVPKSGTRYTGTMLDHFRAAGFTAQRFDGNLSDLEPGDIVLNVANHVEMCVAPGRFGGAHIDEHGNVSGGQAGDQTGNEVSLCNAYVYSDGWDWVLTPPADGGTAQQTSTQQASTPAKQQSGGVRYAVSTDSNGSDWLDEMVGTRDTGGSSDTWAGELGQPIYFIAADCRIRAMTKGSFPDWLPWVSKYDKRDTDNGCAGDGTPVLLVQADGHAVNVHRHGEWDGVVDGITIR